MVGPDYGRKTRERAHLSLHLRRNSLPFHFTSGVRNSLPFPRIESHREENPPESGLDWIAASIPLIRIPHSPSPSRSSSSQHQRHPPAHPQPAPSLSLSIVALLHLRLRLRLYLPSRSSPSPQLGVDRADRYSGAVTKRNRSRCPRKEAARAPFPLCPHPLLAGWDINFSLFHWIGIWDPEPRDQEKRPALIPRLKLEPTLIDCNLQERREF